MRSMWKGTVSFGLVSIPVKLYAATEQHDVAFRQVRHSDGSRIRYKRVAEADGEEVAYADIAKGYELPDGRMIVVDDSDLADLPLPSKRVVDVLEFVPLSEVDPIYFNKPYYLEPDSHGLKPYALLRDALAKTEMVALVKVTIGNREQLANVRVKDDVLVLSTMMWPDEIRKPDFAFLDEDIPIRPQELSMAEALIKSMSSDFDPSQFTDEFEDALQTMLHAKMDGEVIEAPEEPAPASRDNVVDLIATLQASIDKARGGPAAAPARASADDDDHGGAPGERETDEAAPTKRGTAKTKAPAKSGSRSPAKATGKAAKPAAKAAAKSPAKPAVKAAAKRAPRKSA